MSIALLSITALAAIVAAFFAFLAWRSGGDKPQADLSPLLPLAEKINDGMNQLQGGMKPVHDMPAKIEKRLDNIRDALTNTLSGFGTTLTQTLENLRTGVNQKINESLEKTESLKEQNEQNAEKLRTATEEKIEKMRVRVEQGLKDMQNSNEQKLEQMRETVDEKLQKTLQTRLDQSFGTVSGQLKLVYQELGKMQLLSENVDGLKRALTSAPMRGAIGEHMLEGLIVELLSPGQYEKNAAIDPSSPERVEFAIRIPDSENSSCLLPVDSKFPLEDYERFVAAMEKSESDNARKHRTTLLRQIKSSAKIIREKYVKPPHSTDFAILFLPTEGLYSVVANEPGLLDSLRREQQVLVVGPHNFLTMLDTFRMAFRLFAIGQKSKEVWSVLGDVKTEFGKFGFLLEKAKSDIKKGIDKLDDVTGVRTRKIERALRDVESLPEVQAMQTLNLPPPAAGEASEDPPTR